LFTSFVITGSTFSSQTVPLASHCATCVFHSLSRIPDCEVISAVRVSLRFVGTPYTRYILQQKFLKRNTTVQLLTVYTDPERRNAQRYRRTDGRTDNIMMPIADHAVKPYDRLQGRYKISKNYWHSNMRHAKTIKIWI